MAARRDIELDPRFFVPVGVVDVRQDNETNSYAGYTNGEDVVFANEGPILEYPNSTAPSAPISYTITSQQVRIGADGSTVVDVYVEFPDEIVGYDIDVRVTPA